MENLTIVFYNFYHIGDTHLAQPFVKNIITNNLNNQFYIFNNYNTFCYLEQFNNIKDIESNLILKNIIIKMLNLDINNNYNKEGYNSSGDYNINESEHKSADILSSYDNNLKILLINTWIGSFLKYSYPLIDCNLINYNENYNILINNINNTFKLNIKYDNSVNINLYPSIKKIYIESFLNIKNNTNKKIVFYYNYLAKSEQPFPIYNNNEHNIVINYLSLKYIVIIPHKNIELENYIIENNINSIIFAENLLNFNEYYSCKNLYYYAQMAYDSDISIYFDSGRSFLYLNSNFILEKNNNLRFYFAIDNNYYNKLNDGNIIKKDYMKFLEVSNYNDIIKYFISIYI